MNRVAARIYARCVPVTGGSGLFTHNSSINNNMIGKRRRTLVHLNGEVCFGILLLCSRRRSSARDF